MKYKPSIIKYIDIPKNKPIKNKTESTGFLVIITEIPKKIQIKDKKNRNSALYPLVIDSCKRLKVVIILNKYCLSFLYYLFFICRVNPCYIYIYIYL